ncbi:MAG: YCF48-related protein [Saprospiraceae bacterium]
MKNTVLYILLIFPQFLFAQFISRGTGVSESGRVIISMSTVDEQTAWAVTFDGITFDAPTNEWMRTTDGGETWNTGSLPFSDPAMATYTIYAMDAETAYVSAGTQPNFTEGAIYKTTDGGQSWTEQFSSNDRTPGEFIFWDENEGMTFGFARTAPNEVVIYRTQDGGENWQTIDIPGILPGEWCAGYSANGLIDSQGDQVWVSTVFGRILHSTDRGQTWEATQVAPAGRALLGVAFEDEMNGIAVSPAFSSGSAAPNLAFRTSDGGTTWEEITVPANPIAGALEYVPGTEGTYLFSNVIFGETDIAYTHDSGDTWHIMDGPGLWAIDFKSPTVGWVGGEISSATEGGMYRFTSKLSPEQANVTTLAGTSTEGYRLGAARQAQFYNPKGMAADADGNVYVADEYSNSIKKISATGEVSLLAGGNFLFDRTELNGPDDLLILPDGNLLVADAFGAQIKLIDLSGPEPEVSVFAGTGDFGLEDGPLLEAVFNYPTSLATDGEGNIYVGDNNAVRRISPDGTVSTLAGSLISGFLDGNGTEAQFNFIWGIDADVSGNIYAADAFNHAVRKISTTGEVTTLGGAGFPGYQDGNADMALFNYPEDVAIDQNGHLYVADGTNGVIRKITPDGEVSTAIGQKYVDFLVGAPGPDAINGAGEWATFSRMRGLAMRPNGNLLVTEWNTDLVREVQFGKPSHPLVVMESVMENPYRIGHLRHLQPYSFYGIVQNTTDVPLADVEMRVMIRKDGGLSFLENSENLTVPAGTFEIFSLTETFLPEEIGVYEVQFQYSLDGAIFYTEYRDITITDQTLDYGDGLPYTTVNYASFLPEFTGGYALDYEIESPDSLSAFEVGFGAFDSTDVQFSVLKMEGGMVGDTVYASGVVPLDNLNFNRELTAFVLPEAIYMEAGKYLFTFEETVLGATDAYVDNEVYHDHFWIKTSPGGEWENVIDLFGETALPFIIRPVFGNPEIISSAQVPFIELPQISVCPNPFVNQVTISLPAEAERFAFLEMTNLEGKRIDFFRLLPGETVDKNWANLPSGIYFLLFELNGQRGGVRLVKN